MVDICHLENRHDVIFFCRGWSDLDKILQMVQNDMSTAVIMVKIETRCRIPIWQTFDRIQWHVIPESPATLQGAATSRIQCHDSIAMCHIAGCCHLVNSLSRFQSHMPHVQGAVTWRNQCHDRATLQGVRIPSAILKIVFAKFYFCF